MEEKRVRIITDSIGRFINGTDETSFGVVEMHVGLSPKDSDAVKSGEAELVAAIIENGESIIDIIHTPPIDSPTGNGTSRDSGITETIGGISHIGPSVRYSYT